MKNILIIGSTGQIGSELTMMLRHLYSGNVVAGYIPGAEPKGELKESGPSAIVDITNQQQIADAVENMISTPSITLRHCSLPLPKQNRNWLGRLVLADCSTFLR